MKVKRFAVPEQRDAGTFLDDLGMLEAPGYLIGHRDGLIEVDALAAGGSFCLLGEPGAGKTTALEAVTGQPSENQGRLVFVRMAEVTDVHVFQKRAIEPSAAAVAAGERVTVVLDGLEECPAPGAGKVWAALIRELLQEVATSKMRLLIGCRSADYPPAVHEIARTAYPDFTRYDLAPLRRRDVEELTISRGVPTADFLQEVVRTGAGPLASFPLTLDLLLRQYQADSGLHGTAAELYEAALLPLAGEHDADRDMALAPASAAQVLAIAARLCCYLLVCGRAGFWTGPAGQMPPGDLDPGGLAAGRERVAGGAFEVTRPLIAAALNSALFTSGGPYRRVPVHARFAAYLAARHLASRRLPAVQLRSLLTAPMENGAGIIPALRETAAWLLALQPSDTEWAQDADLTVLVVHGALIDAAAMRAALVERVLAHPRSVTSQGWGRSWYLAHPGLGRQLSPVLADLAEPGEPQPGPDLAYLALTLARQASPDEVITPVLQIAARSDLGHGLRAVAARTAAILDEAMAAPVLATVLTEIGEHQDHDPNDELRGVALSALWPQHLTADELAVNLTTPKQDNVLGAYYLFRRRLPDQLSDDDVLYLLEHCLGGRERLPRDDSELAERLLDRAFSSEDADAVVGPAAAVVAQCMRDGWELHLPTAMNDRDAAGNLTAEARRLRQLLAARLVSEFDDGLTVYQLISDWQQAYLLGPADLRWALGTAAAAGPAETASWTEVLRIIWDPKDQDAQAAAWQTRDTPLWAAFAASFDQVVLGSDAEAMQRNLFRATRPHSTTWAAASAHAAELLGLYQRAAGDATAFPQLVYAMHVDPGDGRFRPTSDDDLASRPGIALLPVGWEPYLRQAGLHYLEHGTPPGPGILDTPGQLPLTAQAGYLALAYLIRHPAPGRAAQLPSDDVLARWAPSVLLTGAGSDTLPGPDAKKVLLGRLAGSPAADLPVLVTRFIEGHLTTRTWPSLLEPVDAAYNDELAMTLTSSLGTATAALDEFFANGPPAPQPGADRWEQQVGSLRRTLTVLTEILTRHGYRTGVTAAKDIISRAAAPGADTAALQAGQGTALGLTAGDPSQWTRLAQQLEASPDLLKAVLRDLARHPAPLTDHLNDDELSQLWELLSRYWPVQTDEPFLTSGFVGPDQLARHWRDGVVRLLAQRGTPTAVQVLRQLAASNPGNLLLEDLTRDAEQLQLGQEWSPIRERDLTRLLEDSSRRLVRSSSDLADLVHGGILEAADTLIRTGQLLWDVRSKDRRDVWRPKSEVAFGAWLADQLSLRVARAGVVINREVRVKETTTQHGQAVDIQADAPVIDGHQDEPAVCRIELKGNWHADLLTAMHTQLANDYLIPEKLRYGIYVTAWFDTQLWTYPETRRVTARKREQDETSAELDTQAATMHDRGLDVRSVVIYIPRPVPSDRKKKPTTRTTRSPTGAKPGPSAKQS